MFTENARLGQDLETQKLNLADINEFLTSELEASSKTVRQIEDKAAALQQELDNVKDIHTVSMCSEPASAQASSPSLKQTVQ